MEKGNEIKTVVPALRFPEFQNTEGWKEYILGDFLLEQPRYGINAPAVPFQAKLPTYIRITDISENGCFLPSPKVSVNQGPISDFYLKIGDFLHFYKVWFFFYIQKYFCIFFKLFRI